MCKYSVGAESTGLGVVMSRSHNNVGIKKRNFETQANQEDRFHT